MGKRIVNSGLPSWLEDNLPEMKPVRYVKHDAEGFYVEGQERHYDSLVQAYDDMCDQDDFDFKFSPEALIASGLDPKSTMMVIVENRSLFTITDEDRLRILKRDYDQAVSYIHAWRANPSDPVLSYYMLDAHPAFWTRMSAAPDFFWNSGDLVQKFWHSMSYEGMMMEAGIHYGPDYVECSHDLRLEVEGSSFEDCIVQMAALVDKFYHSNGTERENVDYVKSPLEVKIEVAQLEYMFSMDSAKEEN